MSYEKRRIDDLQYITNHIDRIEEVLKYVVKHLDELEKHIKDIDMDLNDIFDDVEGKYEDNNK